MLQNRVNNTFRCVAGVVNAGGVLDGCVEFFFRNGLYEVRGKDILCLRVDARKRGALRHVDNWMWRNADEVDGA